jgi:itaconyl-CoA hydratase
MEAILPAYKAVGERRYRETSGLYWEDFGPGDVFEHRPGRTVLDVDKHLLHPADPQHPAGPF